MATTTETEAPPKKKRKVSLFWIIMLSPVVIVLLLAIAAAWHHYRLEAAINAELQKIRDAGQPVTPADLAAAYKLPEDAVDRTDEWIDVIKRSKTFTENPNYAGLPIIGTGEAGVPLPGTAWAEKPTVDTLMADAEPMFDQIEDLAREPGAVRFPLNFNDGLAMLLPNAQEMRNIARLLSLRARWQVHEGDAAGAVESLIAMRRSADTMEHEPTLISQLVRVAITGVMVQDVIDLLPHANWNEEQLKRLQDEILADVPLSTGLRDSLMGERVMGNMVFDDPKSLGEEIPGGFGMLRRADQLYYLQTFERMIAAGERSFAEGRQELEAIENEMNSQSNLQQLRHAVTIMIMPANSMAIGAGGRGDASARCVATLIACRRFKLATGAWPQSLSDLTPEFLDTMPIDPFDNQALKFKVTPSEIQVWSIGVDGVDNGGVDNGQGRREPDVVYTLNKFD